MLLRMGIARNPRHREACDLELKAVRVTSPPAPNSAPELSLKEILTERVRRFKWMFIE